MFASRVTKDLPLPSDPSVIVTIRKLTYLQRQSAQQIARQAAAKLSAAAMAAPENAALLQQVFDALKDEGGIATMVKAQRAEGAARSESLDDLMATHDHLSVLVGGVKSWTAPEPVTKETLADLDEDAEFLVREILTLAVPMPLTAEQEKNGSSPSTAA